MRLLAQPDVLRSAAIAAGISALFTFPRLQSSPHYAEILLFAMLMLLWCQFVLWAFVFAWEPAYGSAKPLDIQRNPRTWALVLGGAGLLAAYQYFLVDPGYRALAPDEYPQTVDEWWRQVLFTVGFSELFLCYGPLAYFARLAQDERWALNLTVGFNIFFFTVKLFTMPESPGGFTMAAMIVHRVVIAYAAVRLYRWGGIAAVSLLVVATQSRHLLHIEF